MGAGFAIPQRTTTRDIMPSIMGLTRQVTRSVARTVRHAPGLRSLAVWDSLRPAYYHFLDRGAGVQVRVGGRVALPMPSDLTTVDWRKFEPRTVNRFADWVEKHPSGVVLDLGSSVGIYSAIALSLSPVSEVFSFDGDAIGLRISQGLAARIGSSARHHVLWSLLTDQPEPGQAVHTLAELEAHSQRRLDLLPWEPPATESRFVNINSELAGIVTKHSLDELFADWNDERPLLIKCDIEGAELLALQGAINLLHRRRPTLCLSVHPWLIGQFGGSLADVWAGLLAAHYQIEQLEKDWEEHWWCEPLPDAPQIPD